MSSLNHPRRRFGRLFGDLRVRPKLIVLHNLFFLVLTCAAYFSLIPLVEDRIATAREREISLARQMLAAGQTPSVDAFSSYVYENGVTLVPPVPPQVKQWLDAHPGAVRSDPSAPEHLYRKDPATGSYARLTIPSGFYEGAVGQAKFTLFAILGTLYLLAVALLELAIMPRHVYRPIRLTLKADEAVRDDDRHHELIDEAEIPGDEIGDIMRSRNKTVSNLRDQEAHLESALARLKQLAADLQRKNDLLEAARTKLAAQDRLASLGLLSASVAHELNTPLAVLRGSIEKLIETVDSPSTLRRLKRMQHVTDRLSGISAGLLDFSRPSREVNEPVTMRTLVDEAWSLVAIDEKASGIRFSNRVPEDTQVVGNRDRLMQLFVNLLRNAMYAIPASGTVVVQGKTEARDEQGWVTVAVEDDGVGIPEDVLPNIFEAFVTSRLDARGTGLGLAVAETIVEQHGGRIMAGNRPEGGARLEVRLPAGTATPQSSPASDQPSTPLQRTISSQGKSPVQRSNLVKG